MTYDQKFTDPKEIEREISNFLAKKFGGEVKVITPSRIPREVTDEKSSVGTNAEKRIDFDLKPEELIAYLDQYIVRQEHAKAVLATKICTHFNRIRSEFSGGEKPEHMVGRIKNNVLLIGPTGVGKTYMIKLIARKLGVPFVKGDATKFSETGYVGGDVEDLVRDLLREADDDIEMAQYGIIYIDEIDKIASSRNMVGADVSRTGVQRALLKPMEETDVELKVPHDPISMFQEIERYRKTGKRNKTTINTRNILFIVSGAFNGLDEVIEKRMNARNIGFGAKQTSSEDRETILRNVRSEDLIAFGFESEFVGRLPVHAVLERLSENDLFDIMKNPNNPVVLGKKLDFSAYGIEAKFSDDALRLLARRAYRENTGARGLVNAVENALLPFETALPTLNAKRLPITESAIRNPDKALETYRNDPEAPAVATELERLRAAEKAYIRDYVTANRQTLAQRHKLNFTPSRIEIVAEFYSSHILDIGSVIRRIKSFSEEVKLAELYFYENHDINIVMEEEAIDYLIAQLIHSEIEAEAFYRKLSLDFEHGLKLVRERTGRNRFFITKHALQKPEIYIANMLQQASEIEGAPQWRR